MEVFHDYAYYYNMFYGDKDYAGEAATIVELISRYAFADYEKRILNIGCGTGRHDIELKQLGYRVHGLDLSREMIQIAQKNNEDISGLTYEVQDAREFLVESKFDVVISMFHVMSYQNTNEDLQKVIACVNRALNINGIFIFDVWYGPGVLTDRPSVRVKRVEDSENLLIRIAEPVLHPNENIVDVKYDVNIINKISGVTRTIDEVHNMRYYFKPEIREMLEKNGMRLEACIDCSTLQEPDFDSWTVYFVARKEK